MNIFMLNPSGASSWVHCSCNVKPWVSAEFSCWQCPLQKEKEKLSSFSESRQVSFCGYSGADRIRTGPDTKGLTGRHGRLVHTDLTRLDKMLLCDNVEREGVKSLLMERVRSCRPFSAKSFQSGTKHSGVCFPEKSQRPISGGFSSVWRVKVSELPPGCLFPCDQRKQWDTVV